MAFGLDVLGELARAGAGGGTGYLTGQIEGEKLQRQFMSQDIENSLRVLQHLTAQQAASNPTFKLGPNGIVYQFPAAIGPQGPPSIVPGIQPPVTDKDLALAEAARARAARDTARAGADAKPDFGTYLKLITEGRHEDAAQFLQSYGAFKARERAPDRPTVLPPGASVMPPGATAPTYTAPERPHVNLVETPDGRRVVITSVDPSKPTRAGQPAFTTTVGPNMPELRAPQKPSEGALAVGDYLAAQKLPDTPANRTQARLDLAGAKAAAGQQARSDVTAQSFGPEAIDMAARGYIQTRQLPPLGMAGYGVRGQILNRAAELAKEQGIELQDLPERQATFKAAQTELNRLRGQRGLVLAFARTADKNLDIAQELSDKIGRTGVQTFNRWLQAGRRATGDADVAAFDAAVRVAINETARVTSGQAGGVNTDTARREIESMLNTAQTPQQFRAVVETLKRDMENRKRGYEEQIGEIRKGMHDPAPPPSGTSPGPGPAVPKGAHREGNDIISDSGKYVWRNGTWQPRK